ncbi:MAG: hypothetical protein P8I93_06715 [Crocinitomicaceae bacterium]|nr:hypothetical protein [Crocinitomicaceae bacterium]
MMRKLILGGFFVFVLQIFFLNGLDFSSSVYIMIYPLILFLLPFNTKPVFLFVWAFLFGFLIDFFSNSFGLHASSLVAAAAIRVGVFYLLTPRDGYDSILFPSIKKLGLKWILTSFSFILFFHHFWFFCVEYFSFNATSIILKNTFLSFFFSFICCVCFYVLFFFKKLSK